MIHKNIFEALGEQQLEHRDLQRKLMDLSMQYESGIAMGAMLQVLSSIAIIKNTDKQEFLDQCKYFYDIMKVNHDEWVKILGEQNDTRE